MSNTPTHEDPEKTAGLSFTNTSLHPSGHHSHLKAARERLRHFLHPSGKRIHVADSPQEAINLRRQLEQLHRGDEFDIYISGSPEHLEALRAAQNHHEDRRESLRVEHQEVYERFADVHAELDALSYELDRVTTHGVSLEAHFSKFGYDAQIKTYDDESSPGASGTTTPSSMKSGKDSGAGVKCYAKPLKLFKVPVVRQYFHKGVLWRASGSEEVQSFELFVDLLYVGILAINGDSVSEHPTGQSLLQFIITFTLSWKIWNDMALIISWFETDDIFQRFSVLFLLACLFGMTTNITEAFEHTYATLIGFYLTARLYMASYLVLVAVLVPMVRNIMIFNVAVVLVGAALWIGSIHLEYPTQLALIWVALFMDICGHVCYFLTFYFAKWIGPKAYEKVQNVFEFYPAINIEHRTERMNAFVALVFGYSVVALLYQSAVNGIDAHYGKAVLGLTQAFCFNWLYFEVDGSNLYCHAIRRQKWSSFLWAMSHLPFIMAWVLGAGGLGKLVLAVDTPDSRLEALTELYQERSEEEIPAGIRWFYCAGFGMALMCMGFISISHVHKEIEGLRIRKLWRLTGRFVVAIILICLPLAENLNSLELVGTVTGLTVVVLCSELWAVSSCEDTLFSRSQQCKYTGHCGKKEMEALVRSGKEVDVEQLGSQRTRNSGLAVAPT